MGWKFSSLESFAALPPDVRKRLCPSADEFECLSGYARIGA